MAVITQIKQPREKRTYRFDFSNYPEIVESGETITAINQVLVDQAGLTIDAQSISADGKSVNVTISGGSDGVTYKVSVVVQTSAGHILELDGKIQVKDL